MTFLEELLQKKLLILTGKGGIGKTLVSAALAQYAAEFGKKVLLVERSEEDQLAPLFGHSPVGHKETTVSENLDCINLDSSRCFEEYVVIQLGKKALFEKVFSNSVVRTFLNTIPGLAETMLLGRLYYSAVLQNPLKYDLIVFDAPASGHFYSLLTTPDAVIQSGLGGPLTKEVVKVRDFLAEADKVGVVLVAVPEELVVNESLEFIEKILDDCPTKVLGLIVNKATDISSDADIDRLVSKYRNSPLAEAAQFVSRRHLLAIENQKILEQGLSRYAATSQKVPYFLLPDLGVVEEPLAFGFGKQFLSPLFARSKHES